MEVCEVFQGKEERDLSGYTRPYTIVIRTLSDRKLDMWAKDSLEVVELV